MTGQFLDNNLYQKAYQFALEIIKVFKTLKNDKEYMLSKQLLRSGTSIGANVAEGIGAISKADSSNKISIAYKECLESQYWIDLLNDSEFINEEVHKNLFSKADELGKILFAILKKTRIEIKTK